MNNNEDYIYSYEELLYKVLDLQNEVLKLKKERDKNLDNVMFLSKVADEKQERIDKAIEYIKNNSYIAPIEEIPLFTMNSNPQDLLNILQGSDK